MRPGSDRILYYFSYFYSNLPFTNRLKLEDITGVDVCTRRGYIYPTLTAYFSSGKLKRVDSSDQLSMLNMENSGELENPIT